MLKSVRVYFGAPAKAVYFTIAFIIGCMVVFKSIDYIHPDFSHGFLSDKRDFFDQWYKYFLYLHIVFAPLTIFSGILQFSLNRKTKLHKLTGYIYIFSVAFAAFSGFFMSFKSLGGIAGDLSFLMLSILWIIFTYKAFALIKKGEIENHKMYMTRSFILANSAILLRLFSFITNTCLNVNPVSAYVVDAWLSWLPWLIIFEVGRKLGSNT